MTARQFYNALEEDGRAILGYAPNGFPRQWIADIGGRLVLVASREWFPAQRFVADDELVRATSHGYSLVKPHIMEGDEENLDKQAIIAADKALDRRLGLDT